jgi:cyclophilin family peptidyl-prolyl cis-trans isomerase/HEAT repeat protein
VAVRGLGRLEEPRHTAAIAPLLDDPDPRVRAQAADALAQAHHRSDGAPALPRLLERAEGEGDDGAAAAVARALGRLRLDGEAARRAERALLALSRGEDGDDASPRRMVGVALGLESLARRRGSEVGSAALRARLRQLTAYDRGGEAAIRVPTLAFLALAATGGVAPEVAARGMANPAPAVRRAAALARGAATPAPAGSELDHIMEDPAAPVRIEGVRVLARGGRTARACARLLAATDDPSIAVRLEAVDALAEPCPDGMEQRAALEALATSVDPADVLDWHLPAHALLALARLDPPAASRLLPTFAAHDSPFARAWAARAAGEAGDTAGLRALLRDPIDNVRTAALPGLVRLQGRAADPVLLATVAEREDPQLVMTAARLLEGTDRREAAAVASLVALGRFSREEMETHRDVRLALLDRIAATGDTARVRDVEPYLRDYDPAVARRAGDVLREWTGQRWIAAPRGPDPLPGPDAGDVRAMRVGRVVLHMARGGSVELALLPLEAPTNAFRLWNLARSGTLDGLTLHRVVPNFVVQGGSPGANEYLGHGAYTRDEVGLVPQWRGTVGLSTRGRDTGDGQIYVNLVDNVRLNHDYTILARVTGGMEVVDAVREGDVIQRAEAVPTEERPRRGPGGPGNGG